MIQAAACKAIWENPGYRGQKWKLHRTFDGKRMQLSQERDHPNIWKRNICVCDWPTKEAGAGIMKAFGIKPRRLLPRMKNSIKEEIYRLQFNATMPIHGTDKERGLKLQKDFMDALKVIEQLEEEDDKWRKVTGYSEPDAVE